MIQKFYKYNLEKKQSEKVESHLLFSTLTKDRHCFSFVGAGGKSSLIEVMAAWGTKQGKKGTGNDDHAYFPTGAGKTGTDTGRSGTYLGHGKLGGDRRGGSEAATETKNAGSRLDATGDGTCGSRSDRSRRIETTAL